MQRNVKQHDETTQALIAAYYANGGTIEQFEPGVARAPATTRSPHAADNLPAFTLAEIRQLNAMRR